MTRGNQREIDRKRAQNRKEKIAKGEKSTFKTKDSDAEIMRKKQLAAEEKKKKEEEEKVQTKKKEIVQKQGHKYVEPVVEPSAEEDQEEPAAQEEQEVELVKKIGE